MAPVPVFVAGAGAVVLVAVSVDSVDMAVSLLMIEVVDYNLSFYYSSDSHKTQADTKFASQ